LVAAPSAGSWVCITPDEDIEFIDLTQHRVIPLERGADLPQQHAGNMYVFDEPTPQQVASWEQRGKLFAETLGISSHPGSSDGTLLVSDVANPSFGQEIPVEAMADAETFIARDRVGCVRIDDDWVTCERVEKKEEWMQAKLDGAFRDPRLLGNVVDSNGVRFLELREAIDRFSYKKPKGWPYGTSPSAGPEFMMSLRDAGQTFITHHHDFVRRSGLSEGSLVAQQHKAWSDVARLMHSFEQYDVSHSASAEMVIRSIIRLEVATSRSPKSPDFTGLDLLLHSSVSDVGAAVTSEFSNWLAERQKAQAIVWKQSRLYREEKEAEARKTGGGGSKGGGGGGKNKRNQNSGAGGGASEE